MALHFLQNRPKHSNPQEDAAKIVAKAERKSEELLANTVKEAELLISQTKNFRDDLQKSLKEDIAFQANQFAQNYQALLPEVKKHYLEGIDEQLRAFGSQLNNLALEIEKTFKDKFDNLSTLLKDQTVQEFSIIQKELAEYKQSKMGEIDESVKRVVKAAVSEVVGRTISLSDHQELIMSALDKAKKEGIFGK